MITLDIKEGNTFLKKLIVNRPPGTPMSPSAPPPQPKLILTPLIILSSRQKNLNRMKFSKFCQFRLKSQLRRAVIGPDRQQIRFVGESQHPADRAEFFRAAQMFFR
jgi:hypothetical protein